MFIIYKINKNLKLVVTLNVFQDFFSSVKFNKNYFDINRSGNKGVYFKTSFIFILKYQFSLWYLHVFTISCYCNGY